MESKPLVVVGAGVSGTAAAIEAAQAGVQVTLMDENPIGMSMMGLDVPLFFGKRTMSVLRNKAEMLERVVAANDALAEAEEAGVDVQLGTCVWGAFRNTETSRELDGPQLGLADYERSWLMKYERLIVAAGARDLGMSFAGVEYGRRHGGQRGPLVVESIPGPVLAAHGRIGLRQPGPQHRQDGAGHGCGGSCGRGCVPVRAWRRGPDE